MGIVNVKSMNVIDQAAVLRVLMQLHRRAMSRGRDPVTGFKCGVGWRQDANSESCERAPGRLGIRSLCELFVTRPPVVTWHPVGS
jgi:hypothetical protein